MEIKVISFDLDGTLVDKGNFDQLFWYDEIPKLYAKRHYIDLEKAKELVISEYEAVGRDNQNFYQASYWFEKFELNSEHDYNQIIMDLMLEVSVYPEVKPLLKELMKKYRLVVVTHNASDFMKIKLRSEGLDMYFCKSFSVIDDFKAIKKDQKVFQLLTEKLDVYPAEVLHVGDNWDFDFTAPKLVGIKSIFLDRSGNDERGKEVDTINCLSELKKFL